MMGFALHALMIVAIFLAAVYGSFEATMSLTTASPSRLRPDMETEPCKQCSALVDLIPAGSYVG